MVPYYAIFVYGALGSLLESIGLRRIQVALIAFQFWLLLGLFAGLRGPSVSDDYFNYQRIYDDYTLTIGQYLDGAPLPVTVQEPLFFLLFTGAKTLGLGFPFIIFVIAMLSTWIVYRCICAYSPYPMMSLTLYFAHAYLNRELIQIQSGLAIAMVLYAVHYISERQALKYHLLVLAATCVHIVAFVAMPFYAILRIRFSNMLLFFLLAVSTVMAVVDWLHPVLNVLLGVGALPDSVAVYVGYGKYDRELGVLNNLATVKQIVLLVPLVLYRAELEAKFSYFRELFLFYAAATCWLIAFHHMAILAARVATVFAFAEVILVAMLASLVRERFFAYCVGAFLGVVSLVGNLGFKGTWQEYSVFFQ